MDVITAVRKSDRPSLFIDMSRVSERLRTFLPPLRERAEAAIMRLGTRVDKMLVYTSPDVSWTNVESEGGFVIEYEAFHGRVIEIINVEAEHTPLPKLQGAFFVLRSGNLRAIRSVGPNGGPSSVCFIGHPHTLYCHEERSILAGFLDVIIKIYANFMGGRHRIGAGIYRLHKSGVKSGARGIFVSEPASVASIYSYCAPHSDTGVPARADEASHAAWPSPHADGQAAAGDDVCWVASFNRPAGMRALWEEYRSVDAAGLARPRVTIAASSTNEHFCPGPVADERGYFVLTTDAAHTGWTWFGGCDGRTDWLSSDCYDGIGAGSYPASGKAPSETLSDNDGKGVY